METPVPATGVLIWLSVKPIIRLIIPAGIGFTLIKTGVLPKTGTKAFSTLILNVTLPMLLFSKIIPSFSSSNVSSIGPIILTAFFYQGLGTAFAHLARFLTPTPRRFRYGIYSAYAFSNWGDAPTAVLQTLMAQSPFNGEEDEALAISFVAIFILVNFITMFPFNGLHCVKMDYQTPPRIDPFLEKRYEAGEFGTMKKWFYRFRKGRAMKDELEFEYDDKMSQKTKREEPNVREPRNMIEAMQEIRADESLQAEQIVAERIRSNSTKSIKPRSATYRALHATLSFLRSLVMPTTMTLLIALIIALVPQLKALFVPVEEISFSPQAPDGEPPLAILYDTASFIGAASVPLGLIVLGATLAKLKIPRPISNLPLASILTMSVVKLILLPVIGFFFVRALTFSSSLVSPENKVLRLTLIYFSVVPTGTIQLVYSQTLCPEGMPDNSELLSAYILVQYGFYMFSSVILTALSLKSIF